MMPSVLVCAIAAPLALLFWLCGNVSLLAAFAAMVLATLMVLSIGCALLRALGAPTPSAPAAWVLGVFAISLTLYALVQWLDVRVLVGAMLLAIAAGGLAWWQRLWRAPVDKGELVGIALCGAVTLLWCHYSASAPATLARLGVLPVWVDYMIDGTVISSLGDPLAQGAQSIELAGFPRAFYHSASYLLPAAFAQPFDLPGLPLATSVWLPLGFFTMCAGAHVFGSALAGSAGGLAAVAALALLPDAGDYGLRNALFGFDLHVLTRANAAYGVGIALVSFVLLQRWCEERRPQLLAASVALALGLVVIRAHLFLLAAPCVLAGAVMATAQFRRHRLIYLAGGLALLAAVYLSLDGPRALRAFLVSVHDQPGTAYAGWYESLLQRHGERVAIPLGVLLVFPAFLGVFVLLYPVAVWLRHRSALDTIPLLLIAGYAALLLLAPIPANGDPTEFTHRPFALVYAVVSAWTVAVLTERIRFRWLVAASVAGLVALWPGSGLWSEGPKASWGWNYYARALTPGLAQAAGFLRKEGKPGDQFAVTPLPRGWAPIEQPGWVPTDAAVELAALSGMPAYLARPYLPILEGGERRWVAEERFAALEAIEREVQPQAALGRLAALGIRWYVVVGEHGPLWDAGRRLAVFHDRRIAIYRTTSL
jgi:hypothetical protein